MTTEVEETKPTDEGAGRAGSVSTNPVARRPLAILCVALGLLLVAAVVAGVVVWRDRSDLQARAEAERLAGQEAEQIVVAWLTYDYRTYRDDMTWVTESGTESFRETYSPEALEGLRTQMVGPRKLVSRGRVVNSAADAVDEDTVRVLVFTDQTLTDADIRRQGREPLRARSGAELTMVREGDDWLVEELVQLQFE